MADTRAAWRGRWVRLMHPARRTTRCCDARWVRMTALAGCVAVHACAFALAWRLAAPQAFGAAGPPGASVVEVSFEPAQAGRALAPASAPPPAKAPGVAGHAHVASGQPASLDVQVADAAESVPEQQSRPTPRSQPQSSPERPPQAQPKPPPQPQPEPRHRSQPQPKPQPKPPPKPQSKPQPKLPPKPQPKPVVARAAPPVAPAHDPATVPMQSSSPSAMSANGPQMHAPTPIPGTSAAADAGPSVVVSYRRRNPPQYPLLAIRRHHEGTVVLLVLVGVHGQPLKVEIGASSGYRELDRAAVQAARQWRFNPGRRDGIAYKAWARIPVTFALRQS